MGAAGLRRATSGRGPVQRWRPQTDVGAFHHRTRQRRPSTTAARASGGAERAGHGLHAGAGERVTVGAVRAGVKIIFDTELKRE